MAKRKFKKGDIVSMKNNAPAHSTHQKYRFRSHQLKADVEVLDIVEVW